MEIARTKTSDRHTRDLQEELSTLRGPCVGCTDCDGICAELFDTIVLPDVILSKRKRLPE
jgi:hypothetical protein